MTKQRVTVTLPEEIVRDIDRKAKNRSKFVLQAVQNELEHRRKEELLRSLKKPHPESQTIVQLGMEDWANRLHEVDETLLNPSNGRSIRWSPGEGWVEAEE